MDICDEAAVWQLAETLKGRALSGIIHAAGITRDGLLASKSRDDFEAVTNPKVAGTIILDRVFAHSPLDFFLMCSSITAVMGNPGQTDYAYGNGFMDRFAYDREILRVKGQRQGRSSSFNLPLWQEGGMQVSETIARRL